ncbi:MAG: DNA repair protein RadA [Paracoccaceae bacterium]|nr:DNA repair protein RadA [Paracoccaceae bacterium]
MVKNLSKFKCQNCNFYYSKWAGQCTECGAWSSIKQDDAFSKGQIKKLFSGKRGKTIDLLNLESLENEPKRLKTEINEFDRVLGGGLVPGSAILLSGDPGIGKSTLLLQVATDAADKGANVIYISGEEAPAQIRMRARRLGKEKSTLKIASETNLRDILTTLDAEKVDLLIVDSIQTIYADYIESGPGSVVQVRTCVLDLTNFAKKKDFSIIFVGHVTKDGQIAGPKLVEHMVDTVIHFEGERGVHFRILRTIKNRFGASDEIGVFEMTSKGLKEVTNPSELFLSERDAINNGSVVFASIEGTRPVLVEIQALVAPSSLGTARRTVVGWDSARLSMVIAILDARCGLSFIGKDVYLNVAGGMRVLEPAADLAVAAALLSASNEITLPTNAVIFGELSLSGALRQVNQPDSRIKEAKKLGFKSILIPSGSKIVKQSGIELKEYKTIFDLIKSNTRVSE